jgi:transposase
MPQALLPMIPGGATRINELISVIYEGEKWTYFCGVQPIFQHATDDKKSFRMFTAQLCCQGACAQAEILRTFGVSKNSLLRSVKKYREEGVDGFYRPRRARSGGRVLTPEVSTEAQRLLDLGRTRREVAKELGIHYDTIRKAINAGRLRKSPLPADEDSHKPPVSDPPVAACDKSSRSDADAAAGEEMGVACTRPCERVMAALGLLPGGATTQFQPCRDVSYGGVLCALPALAENGLFRHLETLPVVSGYYMKLAEIGSWIGSRSDGLWVREVRKLTRGGHQTSLITTAYGQWGLESAGLLFSRWSQENFFHYMMEHFAIDALSEYRTEAIPGTNRPVANPRSNRAIQHLLDHLNAAECVYPGTNLRLTYTLSSAQTS